MKRETIFSSPFAHTANVAFHRSAERREENMAGGSASTERDWLLFYFIFGCSVKNCMRERRGCERAGPYIKYTIIPAAVHRWKKCIVCVYGGNIKKVYYLECTPRALMAAAPRCASIKDAQRRKNKENTPGIEGQKSICVIFRRRVAPTRTKGCTLKLKCLCSLHFWMEFAANNGLQGTYVSQL
jgi:hypothetical protein